MRKLPRDDKMGMKKGPWTPEEDLKLSTFIQQHGHGTWQALPSKAGLQRCGKSCRLRWINYLRPDIKRGAFSLQEDQTIIQLHALLGNRWSIIASQLPKRTDNEIKNYWNTHLKKKLNKMGIDPMTHKPNNHALGCGERKDFVNLCHMAQWESARLKAEARETTATATAAAIAPPPCVDDIHISNAIFNEFLASDSDWTQLHPSQTSGIHHDEAKGIMGSSTEPITSLASYSGLPDDFNNLYTCWNVLENGNFNYFN